MEITREQVSSGIVSQSAWLENGTHRLNVVPGQVYAVGFISEGFGTLTAEVCWSDSETPDSAIAFKDEDGTTDLVVSEPKGFTLVMPSNRFVLIVADYESPVFFKLTPIGY